MTDNYLEIFKQTKDKKFFFDTRDSIQNGVFVALNCGVGDGHNFVNDAIKNGAEFALVSKDCGLGNKQIIVRDTLITMQEVAKIKRIKMQENGAKIIGITGSVGKTTTKEICFTVFKQMCKTSKTQGNFNNNIGLPISILNADFDSKFLILEMGINNIKEMETLAKIAEPDYSIITNIFYSHIGNFSSQYKIAEEKSILFKYSKNSCFSKSDDDKINDILFENSSSCITRNMINYNDIINNYEINASKTSFDIYNTKYSINIPVTKKWLSNLCLVLFIYKSIFNKMPENNIFNNISFGSRRWNEKIITKNNKNIKIIDDTYNSSYEAVMEGVTRLLLYKETKLIIIGEILELGKFSIEIHKKLIDDLKKNFCTNIDFIFVGNIFDKINIKNKDSKIFNNKNELIDDFKLNQNKYFSYDIIYAKGSRGVGLDEFINEILK